MLGVITESIPGVNQSQTVDILDITLLKVKRQRVFFCEVMDGIQSFCLCLADARNVGIAFLGQISREMPTRILEDHATCSGRLDMSRAECLFMAHRLRKRVKGALYMVDRRQNYTAKQINETY